MQGHRHYNIGVLVVLVVLLQAASEQSSQHFAYRHATLVFEQRDKSVQRRLVDGQRNTTVKAEMLAYAMSAKVGIAEGGKATVVAMGPWPGEGVLASYAKIHRAPTASSAEDAAPG